MGITKLMHIKERKSGSVSKGLENAIYYIMNPEKTDNQNLIYSDEIGNEDFIYQKFLQTKREWEDNMKGSLTGRQGYHFVISFSEEENVSDITCMDIMRDFVDEYLKGEYDYVIAVHNDTKHKHGHLIFNSVNRETGYKYRYEKGDWEKYIQPITDSIAKRYGLKKLEFTSFEEDSKKLNWKEIIMNDIDDCISISNSYNNFLEIMKDKFRYQVREGTSQKHGLYFSFKPDGKQKAVRSYQLPIDYSPDYIKYRIEGSLCNTCSPVISSYNIKQARLIHSKRKYIKYKDMTLYQKYKFKRMMKARALFGSNHNRVSWQQKRLNAEINRQSREYLYLINNSLNESDLNKKIISINSELSKLTKEIKTINNSFAKYIFGKPSIFAKFESYRKIKDIDNRTKIQKQFIKQFESDFDVALVTKLFNDYNSRIAPIKIKKRILYQERKMCNSIINNNSEFSGTKSHKTSDHKSVKL